MEKYIVTLNAQEAEQLQAMTATFEPLRDDDTDDHDPDDWHQETDAQDLPPQAIRSRLQPGAPGAVRQPADPS